MRGRGDKGLSLPYPLFTKEGKRKTLDPDRVGDDRRRRAYECLYLPFTPPYKVLCPVRFCNKCKGA